MFLDFLDSLSDGSKDSLFWCNEQKNEVKKLSISI